MADDKGSQLNLTVVALVSLVAIVGLVALVMNAAGVKTVATGSRLASADENVAGQPYKEIQYQDFAEASGGGGACSTTVCNDGKNKCCSDYYCSSQGSIAFPRNLFFFL